MKSTSGSTVAPPATDASADHASFSLALQWYSLQMPSPFLGPLAFAQHARLLTQRTLPPGSHLIYNLKAETSGQVVEAFYANAYHGFAQHLAAAWLNIYPSKGSWSLEVYALRDHSMIALIDDGLCAYLLDALTAHPNGPAAFLLAEEYIRQHGTDLPRNRHPKHKQRRSTDTLPKKPLTFSPIESDILKQTQERMLILKTSARRAQVVQLDATKPSHENPLHGAVQLVQYFHSIPPEALFSLATSSNGSADRLHMVSCDTTYQALVYMLGTQVESQSVS